MSVQSTETSYCPPGSITTLLSLNDDVVTIILSFIEPHEAFQLAKSSRYAYAIAMPRVLSEVRVSWYRWQNEYNAFQGCSEYVLSFCSFMLADVEHRIPCLKKLYISGMTFMQQQFDNTPLLAMAELLRRATWLREIELENVDNLLDSEPHFAAALAALPCLDIVSLRGVQHYDSFRMLSRMVSSPRKLELQCSSSMQGEETTFREFMQSPRLIPSLKDLRLRWCAHLIDKLNIHNVLPSVRSLELDGSMCSLSMAAHTFPNLRSIHLGFEFEAASCLASWPNLDHIVIQEPSPYYRPLACPVRWLEIGFSVTQTVFPSILSLVERTSPVVLCLRKVVPREIDMGRLANVVPSLRYLELQMDQLKDSWIVRTIQCLYQRIRLTDRAHGRPGGQSGRVPQRTAARDLHLRQSDGLQPRRQARAVAAGAAGRRVHPDAAVRGSRAPHWQPLAVWRGPPVVPGCLPRRRERCTGRDAS